MSAVATDLAGLVRAVGAPRYRTATEYVEATLKSAILSGALAPGTPLRQEDRAAAFAMSRMPIREALRQLEAQALVDLFVAETDAQIVEITENVGRLAVEAFARFGKGRHRADLNMGDCFAYACAVLNDAALLYKGDDFAHTNLA